MIITDDELVAVVTAAVQAILAAAPVNVSSETHRRLYNAFDAVIAMPPYAIIRTRNHDTQ